ncbi:unannotated protein [freshwater metagenome]|uniref:Unannotated protein n=1 Tax=freshwater metagenome TaxID=449393 RepID=A0A6J6FV65_9ZZZZ
MRCEKCALESDSACAVAEQDDREGASRCAGVASGRVFVNGGHICGQQGADGFGDEVTHVVDVGTRRAFDGWIPDFNLVACGEFKTCDTDRVRAGLGVERSHSGSVGDCRWGYGGRWVSSDSGVTWIGVWRGCC